MTSMGDLSLLCSTPAPFSWRYNIDILLCLLFALDYIVRVVVRPQRRWHLGKAYISAGQWRHPVVS